MLILVEHKTDRAQKLYQLQLVGIPITFMPILEAVVMDLQRKKQALPPAGYQITSTPISVEQVTVQVAKLLTVLSVEFHLISMPILGGLVMDIPWILQHRFARHSHQLPALRLQLLHFVLVNQ